MEGGCTLYVLYSFLLVSGKNQNRYKKVSQSLI